MTLKSPPLAPQHSYSMSYHGIEINDPWHWLKDENYPEVKTPEILEYLNQENKWYEQHLEPLKTFKNKIYEELKGRIKEDDEGVPYKSGNYFYQWKFNKGSEYRYWHRWQEHSDQTIFLDEAERASGHDFYNCRSFAISPDTKLLAWSEDNDGSERYKIFVQSIENNSNIAKPIKNTSGAIVWNHDNTGFYFVELNENHRPYKVRFHNIITNENSDILEEKDDGFFVGIDQTQSRKFLLINIGDHITSEVHIIDLEATTPKPIMVSKRKEAHEYSLDHGEGYFYIRSNKDHKNFGLYKSSEQSVSDGDWEPILQANDENYLRGHIVFKSFVAIEDRVKGLDQIKILSLSDHTLHSISFPDATYVTSLGVNEAFETQTIRLSYSSMVTPQSVLDYDVNTEELNQKKVQNIPSGYNKENYKTERLMAPARDGTLVPISLVYHKNTPLDGSAPLHIYGYGAYGLGIPPSFSTARLSLLDRGIIYAIAHIRGGDEMGYHWYEEGKLEKRTNTFKDFIDCARFLDQKGYSKLGNMSCAGGSAGGSLMGYVANSNPEIWKAIIAHVPFVDILNTMVDESLPLTPLEWPEWGNPIKDKKAFEYIKSYSPYDNIETNDYPAMLITAGLNDPRVTYWEPAKWVAKLRVLKTDNNPLIFKTNMGAGHQGKSGRFEGLEEVAEEYAFLLDCFGINK